MGKKHYTQGNHINCLMCKGANAYADDIYLEAMLAQKIKECTKRVQMYKKQ